MVATQECFRTRRIMEIIESKEERDLPPFEISGLVDQPSAEYVAVYNASNVDGYIIARKNCVNPQPRCPDYTECMRLYAKTATGGFSFIREVLGRERIVSAKYDNLEDGRTFNYIEDGVKKAVIGWTVVKRGPQEEVIPYAALSTTQEPFEDEDFTIPQIIEGIPPGKGTCPFEKNKFAYREGGDDMRHTITIVETDGNKGKIINTIQFPKDLSWAPHTIGFTGPNWIRKENGKGLLLVHGVKINKEGKYEYAFGLAEFEDVDDLRNMRLAKISREPLLTYSEMQTIYKNDRGADYHKELNSNKLVIYSCDGGRKVGPNTHIIVNYGDTELPELKVPTEYLETRPLSPVRN